MRNTFIQILISFIQHYALKALLPYLFVARLDLNICPIGRIYPSVQIILCSGQICVQSQKNIYKKNIIKIWIQVFLIVSYSVSKYCFNLSDFLRIKVFDSYPWITFFYSWCVVSSFIMCLEVKQTFKKYYFALICTLHMYTNNTYCTPALCYENLQTDWTQPSVWFISPCYKRLAKLVPSVFAQPTAGISPP